MSKLEEYIEKIKAGSDQHISEKIKGSWDIMEARNEKAQAEALQVCKTLENCKVDTQNHHVVLGDIPINKPEEFAKQIIEYGEWYALLPKAHQSAIEEAKELIDQVKDCSSIADDLNPGESLELLIQLTFIKFPETPKPSNSLADWFEYVYQGKPRPEAEPETRCLAGYSINMRRE